MNPEEDNELARSILSLVREQREDQLEELQDLNEKIAMLESVVGTDDKDQLNYIY